MKPKLEARVYLKGKLICVGRNSYTSSTKLQRRFGGGLKPFVHAELDAIREALYKLKDLTKLNDCELWVERVRGDGKLGLAKPCDCCQAALRVFTFKRVYYTTESGWKALQ